jgi:hypothetical protein
MNTIPRMDPSQSSTVRPGWQRGIPVVAVLVVVGLVAWGIKLAWEKDDPRASKLPVQQPAISQAGPKPAPETRLDFTAKVVDDETGKPVEKFGLQGGAKQDGKMTWGYWTTSSSNYRGGILSHSVSGKIGEQQYMRILADGYLPEPVPGLIVGQPAIDDMVIRLSRGGTIRGKIVDHEGKPSSGAGVFLAAGGLTVSLRDGKPENFSGTLAKTDEKGMFRMRGVPKGAPATIYVVAPTISPWKVDVANIDEELEVTLPEPGKLRVKYDIEGAAAEGTIHIHIKSWEMPGWKGVDSYDHPKVKNGGEVILDHLAPGIYDFARSVQAGHHGLFPDRTTVVIESGKMAEAGFVRKEGTRVSGKITGVDENAKIESGTVYVLPPDKAGGERAIFGQIIDAVGLVDGKFKTPKLLPGDYVVSVDVYLPEPPSQVYRSGLQMPDYTGKKTVTVPASGAGPEIVVEMKLTKKAEPAPAGETAPPTQRTRRLGR